MSDLIFTDHMPASIRAARMKLSAFIQETVGKNSISSHDMAIAMIHMSAAAAMFLKEIHPDKQVRFEWAMRNFMSALASSGGITIKGNFEADIFDHEAEAKDGSDEYRNLKNTPLARVVPFEKKPVTTTEGKPG